MSTLPYYTIMILLGALAIPAVLTCAYLLLMTLLSAEPHAPPASSRKLRFDVIVPAHNEAAVIERTVTSLCKLDWPKDLFRILVVADNCTDATAALARAAGAQVLERTDVNQRGKGYALEFAFQKSRDAGWAHAVVIVDADSIATGNLLEAFAARIEHGAHAIQAHYGVLNAHAAWRTRVITIAMALVHVVRGRARECMHVSCGIKGNGWALTHTVLQQVPYRAYSLAEDLEYGIALGMAGQRVHYADEASVLGEMVTGEQAARKQRQRWEQGRLQLVAAFSMPLLLAAVRRRSALCLDLALDLLTLPLAYVVVYVGVLILLAGTTAVWLPSLQVFLWLGLACLLALLMYVARGWHLSGVGLRGLKDCVHMPGFIFWKMILMLRGSSTSEWIRTDREQR